MQIRNVRTGETIGVKDDAGNILVPLNGQVTDFVNQYQALENYDMGMVAELYDKEAKKVSSFVLFYAFKEYLEYPKEANMKVYRVLEEPLTNLDILEIIYHYSNLKDPKEKRKK